MSATTAAPRPSPRQSNDVDPKMLTAMAVLFGWAIVGFLYVNGFYAELAAVGPDDTDVMMRLVEIRDLLGGQAWFDTTQARMNAPAGFVMHWSRLIDAPIAAMILGFEPLVGRASAEALAMTIWPTLLIGPFLALAAFIGHRLGSVVGGVVGVVFAASAPAAIAHFRVGGIDHHNVQMILCLALVALAFGARDSQRIGLGMGATMALMLAIGLETLPHIVAMAGLIALGFVIDPGRFAAPARGLGLGLAAVTSAIYVATVPMPYAAKTVCDALSPVYLTYALIGGGGLAALTFVPALAAGHWLARLGGLGAIAAAVIAYTAMVAPECFHGPLFMLDQRLKTMWFDEVEETKNLFRLWAIYPGKEVIGKLGAPVFALAGATIMAARTGGEQRWPWLVALAITAVSVLLAMLQVRYGAFSNAIAAPVAAALFAAALKALAERARPARIGLATVAFLAGCPFAWTMIGTFAIDPALATPQAEAKVAYNKAATECFLPAAYERLNGLPTGTILNSFNLGTAVLMRTRHSVVSGHYHRNTAGMLDVIDAFMAEPEAARAIVERRQARYIATCAGDYETALWLKDAPNGLLARLMRGEAIAWARPLDRTGPIHVWEVVR